MVVPVLFLHPPPRPVIRHNCAILLQTTHALLQLVGAGLPGPRRACMRPGDGPAAQAEAGTAYLDPQREGQGRIVLEGGKAGHDVPAIHHAIAAADHCPKCLNKRAKLLHVHHAAAYILAALLPAWSQQPDNSMAHSCLAIASQQKHQKDIIAGKQQGRQGRAAGRARPPRPGCRPWASPG